MSINATRTISKRIIFKADLVLTSAAVFGNGDSDPIIDMMILRDSCDPQKALLPGSSLAGALRSYLVDLKEDTDAIDQLFGCIGDEEAGGYFGQSRLLISDAVSLESIQAELRDGVRIDHATRTAADQAKYDLEVLPAGTRFKVEFEFIEQEASDTKKRFDLLPLVIQALHGLQTGQISLGMKKNRGLGQCSVKGWDIYEIDMTKPAKIFVWLSNELNGRKTHDLYAHFDITPPQTTSRYPVTLTATFTFADDAMLIRSAPQDLAVAPDTVHLQTRVDGTLQPVIPGTSWAGVLRHRALRILHTLGVSNANEQIDQLFGFVIEQPAKAVASRISIKDSIIQVPATKPLVQNRIAIDRFTGGAFDGALFSEMPVWKTTQTCVTLEISIKPSRPKKESQQDQQKPEDTPKPDPEPTPKFAHTEVGLLLLLLKDLWTSDLAVGGTSSIGRGRLQGLEATLTVDGTEFCFKQATDGRNGLEVSGDREQLKKYVEVLGAA